MPPDRHGPGKPPPRGAPSSEVYFEFIPAGVYVRVTAIDARTGREATIVGDVRAPRAMLEQVALKKLQRLLNPGKS